MVKVLHIITRLDMGGSATNTIETAVRLDKNKFETALIFGNTYDPDNKIVDKLKTKGICYLFIKELQREINPWLDIISFIKLYREIKKGGYSIVHTHSSKAGILGRWAAWMAGVKYIIHTPHGHVFYGYFGKIKTGIFIFIERITAIITQKIITLTKRGKEEHIEFHIACPEKFIQIYSGIDFSKFESSKADLNAIRGEFNIRENEIVFGTVTRLDPVKGNKFLIDAMAEVVKKLPDSKLLIIGDGIQKKELVEKTKTLGISDKIIFAGFRQDKYDLIKIFSIFVLSSINEGMGRVLLEAMSCEKPIIASNTGGIPELVIDGQTGMLVEPGNSIDLAQAMIKLALNAEDIERYGKNGKKYADDVFSMDIMIQEIENLYESLLNK